MFELPKSQAPNLVTQDFNIIREY
ncbi:hypothetical protein TSAR_008150 [Trichomalopsis sarcophagae]|uniref:Uncharacterized protein n=1 Tax=Trichomalopsis sarcophagae TaxID=543379 RepID=A0A232EH95_9HYME|nr:hypothetical protein TSAR_008150 [Trichomalopsis sarcophagae]